MDKRIKVAIAGMGRSGVDNHANPMKSMADQYDIVAVCDPHDGQRRRAQREYGCRVYSDFESLLAHREVELVIIATPNHLHAQHSIAALEAGKNVVCEKPMATTLSDCDMMIAAAEQAGRLLTVFQSCRFTPDYLKVQNVIASGKLGRIVMIRIYFHRYRRRRDWQTLKECGGGQLLNNGSHFLDRAMDLLGDVEPQVFCDLQKTTSFGDAEDHFKVVLTAPGAATIDIEVTDACACPFDIWQIMGTHGGLIGSASSLRWRYVNPKDLSDHSVSLEPNVPINEELPWIEESWEQGPADLPAKIYFYRQLYKTIRDGAPLDVTPQSARRTMWCIDRCMSSCSVKT